MNLVIGILLTFYVIVCILLTLIVLMQRPRSEGLGTAFGGGLTDTLFGSSTGNVLTKITTWLGVIFFVGTFLLAFLYSHQNKKAESKIKNPFKTTEAPKAAAPAPVTVPVTPAPAPAEKPAEKAAESAPAKAPEPKSNKK